MCIREPRIPGPFEVLLRCVIDKPDDMNFPLDCDKDGTDRDCLRDIVYIEVAKFDGQSMLKLYDSHRPPRADYPG